MADVILNGKLLRWGNSYGFRLRKSDVERAGLNVGDDARLRITTGGTKVDLSDLPFFRSGHTDTVERHDEILGAKRFEEVHGKRRRD